MPYAIPVTTPPVLTAAVVLSELLHTPPVGPVVSEVELPRHINGVPVMGTGVTLTVTVAVVKHPAGSV